LAGWAKNSSYRKRFLFPVTLAPTPYFNVLATSENGKYLIWQNGKGAYYTNKVSHSLKELLAKGLESFTSKSAKILPSDVLPGQYFPPQSRPENLVDKALFLGGIGEAAWHHLEITGKEEVKMIRYYNSGEFEFEVRYSVTEEWVEKLHNSTCQLTHDTHHCWITFQCNSSGEKRRFHRKIVTK
jgi:hypothetical protein